MLAAADVFRDAGHQVEVIDQYDGRVFSDYAEAGQYVETIGYPELMASALRALADYRGRWSPPGSPTVPGWPEVFAAARGGPAGGVLGSLQFSGRCRWR